MSYDVTGFYNDLNNIWKSPDFFFFFKKYSNRKPISVKKGNMICYEGDQPDKVYLVKKGFVKMFRTSEEGKNTITYLYGPGTMLGLRAFTSKDRCYKHSVQTLTDTEILPLSREDYLTAVSQNPTCLIDLLRLFIDRLNQTENRLEGFITTDAQSRVANFLLDCTKRFGQRKGNKIIISIPLTHQLIAEFVGSVRETVTVALNELENNKILNMEKHQIEILDIKKLEQAGSVNRK